MNSIVLSMRQLGDPNRIAPATRISVTRKDAERSSNISSLIPLPAKRTSDSIFVLKAARGNETSACRYVTVNLVAERAL